MKKIIKDLRLEPISHLSLSILEKTKPMDVFEVCGCIILALKLEFADSNLG
jgi:hypothetical protein